jgi:hypothetical protein
VQANLLCEPDDSTCSSYSIPYVIVPLAATGSGGECISTASVSAPSGYSGSISIGDTLTAILAAPGTKLWFGTVFEVPQGVTCIVPDTGNGTGYNLPVMAIDPNATGGLITAANHRWIIFRTHKVAASDFPPFGSRINPSYATSLKLGGFQQLAATIGTFVQNGTIFKAAATGQFHHFWIENLEFSLHPTNLVSYGVYLSFGLGSNGQPAPFPRYISVRDIYFHSPARSALSPAVVYPNVQGLIYGTMQTNMQWAIVGNYADNSYANNVTGAYPIPIQFSDGGFTNTSGYGGPVLVDNNYVDSMGEPIYVEVNNHINPNPNDFTITHNATYMSPAEMAYMQALNVNGACSRARIELKGISNGLIEGNFLNGQGACANIGPSILLLNSVDAVVRSNLITRSAGIFSFIGSNTATSTQSFVSSSNRMAVVNNYAYNLGRTLFGGQGGGNSELFDLESGIDNLSITNNTIGTMSDVGGAYGTQVFFFGGGGPYAGFSNRNNVMTFGVGGGGVVSGGGILAQNTIGLPSHLYTPAGLNVNHYSDAYNSVTGVTDGTPNLGMSSVSVIAGGSGYTNGASLTITNCTGTTATIGASGGAVTSTTFSALGTNCNPASWTATASTGTGASLRPHYGLRPLSSWGSNTMICGTYGGVAMTSAQCQQSGGSSVTSTMPTGDTWPLSSTVAGRQVLAGVPGIDTGDATCTPTAANPCASGANMNLLESALGIVSHISTSVSAFSIAVNYTAPDSRTCSVDLSGDGGTNWTRQSDSGGSRARSVAFTGLTASHAYLYRINGYFDQTEAISIGWLSFPPDPSNLQTNGTATTLASASVTPTITCNIAAFSGATSCIVTMTPISGSPVTCTSTGVSCAPSTIPVGDYSVARQWLAGAVGKGASDAQRTSIR